MQFRNVRHLIHGSGYKCASAPVRLTRFASGLRADIMCGAACSSLPASEVARDSQPARPTQTRERLRWSRDRSAAPLCLVTITYEQRRSASGTAKFSALRARRERQQKLPSSSSSTTIHATARPSSAASHPLRPMVIRTGRNSGYAAAGMTLPQPWFPRIRTSSSSIPMFGSVPGWSAHAAAPSQPSIGIVAPRNLTESGATDPTIRREPSVWRRSGRKPCWGRVPLGSASARSCKTSQASTRNGGPIEWATGCRLS